MRGINRKTTRNCIYEHFSSVGELKNLEWNDLDPSLKNHCLIEFATTFSAQEAVTKLHHSYLNGTALCVRFEHEKNQSYILCKKVQENKEPPKKKNLKKLPSSVFYSNKGFNVDGIEYPIPQGLYLLKLLQISRTLSPAKYPLFDLLIDNNFGNKQIKEITESMAMVNAMSKLGCLTQTSWESTTNVTVYVVGDGQTPFTAAALALFMPNSWKYISIDPILVDFDMSSLGDQYSKTMCVVPLKTQEYNIETEDVFDRHVVVIACHSHAPLQEFWDRLVISTAGAVSCVSLPCCGRDWSNLSITPLDDYEDFEILSPKRRVTLYHRAAVSSPVLPMNKTDRVVPQPPTPETAVGL